MVAAVIRGKVLRKNCAFFSYQNHFDNPREISPNGRPTNSGSA
jgi:hypothetical protein